MGEANRYEAAYLELKQLGNTNGINSKQLKDMIRDKKRDIPTIVSFNGSGFDLHFLVRAICDNPEYIMEREPKMINKSSSLVVF